MRPKNYIEDITTLTNTLAHSMTYSQHMEEQLEYLDEYVEFISEFLTEFRYDRVYVTELPAVLIHHPEGWRRLYTDLDPNLADTPINHSIVQGTQYMHSFEILKDSVRRELSLNREVFIYNILPFRHMDSDGEIRYRPVIMIKKHKL